MNQIFYEVNGQITIDDFIQILKSSTLGKRRPVEDRNCIAGMLRNANLMVVARDGNHIIGIARSVTDFHYCCYLSDLAVHVDYQKHGIGKMLIQKTREMLGPRCKLILLSAPDAVEYYPKIGFTKHNQAWILDENDEIK